jgi:hypothetical protein
LDNFKTYILSTLGSQLDTLKIKQKKEVEDATLTIYCPKCRKIHPLKECPLDNIELCGICADNHATENFPSLPELKETYQGKSRSYREVVFCCTKKTLVAKDFRYISRSLSTIQSLLFSTIPPTKLDHSYALESMATTTSPKPTLATRLARIFLWNHACSSLSYATTIHPISFTKLVSPTSPTTILQSTTTTTNFTTSTASITIKSTSKTYPTTCTTHF